MVAALGGCQGETVSYNGDKEIVERTDIWGKLVERRTYHEQQETVIVQTYDGKVMREEQYYQDELTLYEISKTPE